MGHHHGRQGGTTIEVTAVPAKPAPQPLRALLPSIMGSVLDVVPDDQRRLRIYVTGDTLLHDGLADIPRRSRT